MSHDERLEHLISFSSSEDRICPQPGSWDALWRLLGQPHGLLPPPLILSGWAFSTDREKRERFADHLRFASSQGKIDEVDHFVRSLEANQWHTCDAAHLDWSYGDSLREEGERRARAVNHVRDVIEAIADKNDEGSAFARPNLAESVLLYSLMLNSENLPDRLQQAKSDTDRFISSVEDEDWSLLEGVNISVSNELRKIVSARKAEVVFLEILAAIHGAKLPLDRDVIEEIVEEAFDARGS